MNVNTLQASKRKNRLSIASLIIIGGLVLITSNTASASHGHYNDGSNLSISQIAKRGSLANRKVLSSPDRGA